MYMEIKIDETYQDNNNLPHGLHRFLFPFSMFSIFTCYMKPTQDRNTEPELPVDKHLTKITTISQTSTLSLFCHSFESI